MKLGRFWKDPWPFPQEMGVGLRLTGYPSNEKEFLGFLHQESCNPIAAIRILKELKERGEKLTTVRANFNFARLGDEFERLGVKMEVIPPVEKINDTVLDLAALDIVLGRAVDLSHFTEAEAREIEARAQQTGKLSKEEIGPYQ